MLDPGKMTAGGVLSPQVSPQAHYDQLLPVEMVERTHLCMDLAPARCPILSPVSAIFALRSRSSLLFNFEQGSIGVSTGGYSMPFDACRTGEFLLIDEDHGV